MKTIKASDFKARCLRLMDEVAESGEPLVITKNGRPVSRLVPYRERVSSLWGLHRDRVEIGDDLIAPTGEGWEANR